MPRTLGTGCSRHLFDFWITAVKPQPLSREREVEVSCRVLEISIGNSGPAQATVEAQLQAAPMGISKDKPKRSFLVMATVAVSRLASGRGPIHQLMVTGARWAREL